MVAFNPPVQSDLGTNYTGYSQGQTPNRALGELFSGIADAVKLKKAQDQKNAMADVQSQVDNIAVQGMGGSMPKPEDLFTSPSTKGKGSATGTPPEVASAQSQLDRYRQAYQQGTMSDLYFSTQVASLSKKLRSKYPGMEDKIDAMIGSAIGTSTANDIRKELIQTLNAEAQTASSAEKQRMAMLEKYDKYISDPEVMTTYEKLTKSKFDMNNFNQSAFLYSVSIQEQADAEVTRRKNRLELLNAEDGRDQKTAKSIAMDGAAKMRDKILYVGLNTDHGTQGTNFTKLQDLIDKSLAGDNVIDPTEKKAIEQVMAMTEVEINRYADQYLTQNKLDSLLPSGTDREDVRNVILEPFNVIKQAMTNQEYGILGGIKRDAEARKIYEDNKFLSKDNGLSQYVKVAKDLYGSDIVESYFRKQAGNQNLTEEEKAVGAKINMMLLSGKSLTETLSSAVEEGGLQKGSVAMSAVDSFVQTLSDPKTSKEAAAKSADALFGAAEGESLSKFSAADNTRLFDLFTNSALVDKLKGTDAGEKMYAWARNQAKYLLKPLADQIADTQEFSDSGKITFNPKSGRFEISSESTSIGTKLGGPLVMGYDKYKAQKGAQAVSRMNHYLDQIEPIITANGEKMDVFLNEMFIGRDYKSLQKQGSMFGIMMDSFYQSIKGAMDSSQKGKPQGDTSPPPLAPNMPRPDLEGRGGFDVQGSLEKGKTVVSRLMADFGLSAGAAQGFVGNLMHESKGFKALQEEKPMVKGSKGGYGWAQWTGPRRRAYMAFAKANGLDPASDEANYAFLKEELLTTEKGTLAKLQGIDDPIKAAEVSMNAFFRPGIPHLNNRAKYALALAD